MFFKNLDEISYTVFDTETTGMSPAKGARLVEVGAVRILPGLEIDLAHPYNELINPLVPIPYQAYKVHGIDDKMVKDKPVFSDIAEAFKDFVGDTVVVAHNARFDFSFMNFQGKQAGHDDIIRKILCTIKIAKAAFPGLFSYSLDNLIRHFDIEVPMPGQYRHRAVYDAAHTAILLTKCIRQLKRDGVFTLQDLHDTAKSAFIAYK